MSRRSMFQMSQPYTSPTADSLGALQRLQGQDSRAKTIPTQSHLTVGRPTSATESGCEVETQVQNMETPKTLQFR